MNSRQFQSTTGTVLAITPVSETSHVVTWLTPDLGKLVTVAKGAYRPKSIFLGQYDLFYTCEVLFYRTKPAGMHIARECWTINSRTSLRQNWRAACAASYICDLASKNVVPYRNERNVFELTNRTLDFFTEVTPAPQVLLWYELALAGAIGLSPRLFTCPVCERPLVGKEHNIFSVKSGGLVCGKCSEAGRTQNKGKDAEDVPEYTIPVTPDIFSILRRWQNESSPRFAQTTKCTPSQMAVLSDILLSFLSFHAAPAPVSRAIALNLLLKEVT
jgi:DNA repair protein RecO (recombination protein O)